MIGKATMPLPDNIVAVDADQRAAIEPDSVPDVGIEEACARFDDLDASIKRCKRSMDKINADLAASLVDRDSILDKIDGIDIVNFNHETLVKSELGFKIVHRIGFLETVSVTMKNGLVMTFKRPPRRSEY